LRILYLEDEPRDAELVQASLEAEDIVCDLTRADTQASFLTFLQQGGFDLILADYTLPLFDGISALKIAQEIRPEVPFIFVSGTMGEELAIEALKMGATDYVFKTRLSRIAPSVRRALREAEERSQRRQAQEALQRKEAYLAEAQRLSHTGSFGWQVASGKIDWSDETYRIFELGLEIQPTLELALERIHPEDRQLVQEVINSATQEEKDFDFEHRLLMPDGSVKYVRVVGHPTRRAGSDDLEFVGAVTDITKHKHSEEERERLRAELGHINRASMIGELAASIAHEVNQPLSGIVSNGSACVRWLAGDVPNLEEAREAVRRIVRDGKRAGEVIARIRALARRTAPPREQLDLNETIREVLALVRDEAIRTSVMIRTRLADDLSPVSGDQVQLQQVVLNLVMNAIEAMSSVGDRARELVLITRNIDPDQVQVTVQDSGIGLDPTTIERMFDPFYTTKPGGMGMGLSISRSIIQAHKGRLWATANNGPGATVQFTVPRYQEEASLAEV
jgi:signal transduction histidine kinase/DNA-binding NarL/FixJ family response regulator